MQAMTETAEQLEQDCLTLVLRLIDDDESTFSPETAAVMDKWRDRAMAMVTS